MNRKNISVDFLKENGWRGANDFGLDQMVRAMKRGDRYEMTTTGNGFWQMVTAYADDGCKSGCMMRETPDSVYAYEEEEEEEYDPPYSPTMPWNAPGMSPRDFI